jgi:hypothetical protein
MIPWASISQLLQCVTPLAISITRMRPTLDLPHTSPQPQVLPYTTSPMREEKSPKVANPWACVQAYYN